MRRWFGRPVILLGLLAGCAAVLAGCVQGGAGGGQPSVAPSDAAAFTKRAAEVAEAWRSSRSGESGRQGFAPLGDLTVLPPDVRFTNDTKLAYGNGWFRSTARLSTEAPSGGTVRFAGGDTLSVPLISAAEAYRAIDKGDPPCSAEAGSAQGGTSTGGGIPPAVQTGGPELPPMSTSGVPAGTPPTGAARPPAAGGNGTAGGKGAAGPCAWLTVTGVKLGTVRLHTSRGEATVPAWLFTVDEIAGPVARVAVAPSAISTASAGPPIAGRRTATVDGSRLTYRIIRGCAKDITPLVYEAEDVVVVGVQSTPEDGVCPLVAKLEPVTVTLREPLGDRVVLDVTSGQPYEVR
jgi:hypothetical protein